MAEPGAAVESLTPDASRTEMEAMRGHVGLYDATHPEHAALNARMNALDRQVRAAPAAPANLGGAPPHGEVTPPASVVEETPLEALNRRAAEASALELRWSDGEAVEPAAQDALRALVVTHDIPPAEVPTFVYEAVAAQGLAGRDAETRRTDRDAVLAEKFGEHADLWIDRAAQVLEGLPAVLRGYIREYRMLEDAWIWERAAERWKQQRTGG
jgi:hypothetical protein